MFSNEPLTVLKVKCSQILRDVLFEQCFILEYLRIEVAIHLQFTEHYSVKRGEPLVVHGSLIVSMNSANMT